jgi:Activator of Hsp90 ATPase homolog 1-like protein
MTPAVPPGASRIEVDFDAAGDGTRVHFVQRDLPNSEAAASHAHGWDHYLERLETAAVGGDAGDDPWLDGGMS